MAAETILLERIREALVEACGGDPPALLAEQMAATAAISDLTALHIVLWLHERPRHEITLDHFHGWCARHGIQSEARRRATDRAGRIVQYAAQAVRCGLITRRALAARSHLDGDYLRQILAERAPASDAAAAAIAKALAIEPQDLFTLEELAELQP